MEIAIPSGALVVLIGPSGAGKSTFAARHFKPTEVISSDRCRALVSDREDDLKATPAAFRLLHAIARERLRTKRLTVIDATSVLGSSRRSLVDLATRHDAVAVAIVFDLPLTICLERNSRRAERRLPDRVIERQHEQMRRSLAGLEAERFTCVYVMASEEAVASADVKREPRRALTA